MLSVSYSFKRKTLIQCEMGDNIDVILTYAVALHQPVCLSLQCRSLYAILPIISDLHFGLRRFGRVQSGRSGVLRIPFNRVLRAFGSGKHCRRQNRHAALHSPCILRFSKPLLCQSCSMLTDQNALACEPVA